MKKIVKLLLAEDEAITALSMKMELTNAGYNVCEIVATGEEVIIKVEQNQPDLVIMDIHLAGKINGMKVAKKIKDSYQIPIIFVTGYPDKRMREQAYTLNPLGYFVKPVKLNKLISTIDKVFE